MKLNKILFIFLMSFALFIMIPAMSFAYEYEEAYLLNEANTVQFQDNLSLNFFAAIPEDRTDGAYVIFDYYHYGEHISKKVNINTGSFITNKGNKLYRFGCPLTASEMMINVSATLYLKNPDYSDSTQGIEPYIENSYASRSIRDYMISSLTDTENPLSEKERNLAIAALNYGGYTQMTFKYNGEYSGDDAQFAFYGYKNNFTSEKYSDSYEYFKSEVTSYDKSQLLNPYYGIRYVGASVFLRNAPYVRYYFTYDYGDLNLNDFTFTITQTSDDITKTYTVSPIKKGNMYYIQSKSVKAYELDNKQTVSIKKSNETEDKFEFDYSILKWAELAFREASAWPMSDQPLSYDKEIEYRNNEVNVAKAMFDYYFAAKAFVNKES